MEAAARAWQCETSGVLDLSTGLYPAGAPAWLGEWLKENASLIERYPDPDGEPARSALADELGVKRENVMIAAGAQAVIEVIFQAMGWRSMAIQVPCYNEPIRCARCAGCVVHAFEAGLSRPAADILWQTDPANPSGMTQIFPQGTAGVIDESYMPFHERRGLGPLSGVIRLGSLTKTFRIPGLRLGYIVANVDTIRRLRVWFSPWATSALALHLLPKLLPEADMRDARTLQARRRMVTLLQAYGWNVRPSEASFVLAFPPAVPPDFPAHRVLVRTFPEWPQLVGWMRFGLPGSEVAWQRFEEALCP